ncbi:MAG: hypothetical protein JXN62_11215 [Bacteroidales bacterium]|nr:hypothetical protein [Bacteroidales bacterium]
MKRLFISVFVIMLVVLGSVSCSMSRKTQSELRGLMLLDNTHLGRNKAYYSKHNKKTRKDAYRKYAKNYRK